MTSEAQKSQQLDPTLSSTNQTLPETSTEKSDGNFHRRSLLKGATMAAASLGALGGLALPGGALPAHAAAATPRRSSVRLSPKTTTPTFKFSLEDSDAQEFAGGTVKTAVAGDIEELTALSLFSERIEPGAMHELHWHPNAHELAYCLSGQGEIGIFFTGTANAIFPIEPGSVSFIPTGATHYIRNTGSDVLHMMTAFSNEDPEHIDFSDTMGFFPHNVLSETFGLTPQNFPNLPQQRDQFLVSGVGQVPLATPVSNNGPFTANFKDIPTQVFGGGTVTPLTTQFIPSLDKITLFILQAQPGAVREPHWHQNANELNYCVQGTAQFQIFAPDEHRESFTLQPGDVSFIPQNYFHAITNTSNETLTLLIFFSNNTVGHIDLSQVMGFFPRELFAASFGSDLHIFDNIPNVGDVSIAPKV